MQGSYPIFEPGEFFDLCLSDYPRPAPLKVTKIALATFELIERFFIGKVSPTFTNARVIDFAVAGFQKAS